MTIEERAREMERLVGKYVLEVNEYDDRTSPDDWPEALLITSDELDGLLKRFAADIAALTQSDARNAALEEAAQLMDTRAAMHAETASEEEYMDHRARSAARCHEAKDAAKAIRGLIERQWTPHLDYAGEPMKPGEFRDPPLSPTRS